MFSALRAMVSGWLANHVPQPHHVRFRVVVDNSRADIDTSVVLVRLDEARRCSSGTSRVAFGISGRIWRKSWSPAIHVAAPTWPAAFPSGA